MTVTVSAVRQVSLGLAGVGLLSLAVVGAKLDVLGLILVGSVGATAALGYVLIIVKTAPIAMNQICLQFVPEDHAGLGLQKSIN